MTDWTLDPRELDLYLDGDLPPEEAARRDADLRADPEAARRVEGERALRATTARAREAYPEAPEALEVRVRRALAADRVAGFPSGGAGERRRLALVGAVAMAAAAVIAIVVVARPREGVAADRPTLLAAEAFRGATIPGASGADGIGLACGDTSPTPHGFPPVSDGELTLASCRKDDASSARIAVVTSEGRPEDRRGLVVVPWDGKSVGTDVGVTRLQGDVVVFDVTLGGAKYLLAARWSRYEGTPMCAACHAPLRADHPERNPHRFLLRD